jgi:hypothetical protein
MFLASAGNLIARERHYAACSIAGACDWGHGDISPLLQTPAPRRLRSFSLSLCLSFALILNLDQVVGNGTGNSGLTGRGELRLNEIS